MAVPILKPALVLMMLASGGAAQAGETYYRVNPGVTLNGRVGPGTVYQREALLPPGTKVQMVARYGNWLRVRTPSGQILWVYAPYLTQILDEIDRAGPKPMPHGVFSDDKDHGEVKPPPGAPHGTTHGHKEVQPPHQSPAKPYMPEVKPKPGAAPDHKGPPPGLDGPPPKGDAPPPKGKVVIWPPAEG